MNAHPPPRSSSLEGMTADFGHGETPVGSGWLFFAALGGAVAWAVRLMLAYPLVLTACAMESNAVLYAVSGATALVAAAAAATGWRFRHAGGDRTDRAAGRARFMARAGAWTSLLFLLIIAAETLAIPGADPCAHPGGSAGAERRLPW